MATLSSLGIGSGLPIESIITKLVDLEKQPLTLLKAKSDKETAQISSFGQLQSQLTALGSAADAMSTASGWVARTSSSSNTAAATISVTADASATNFSLDVDALAAPQSLTSSGIVTGSKVGAGTMLLRLGSWSGTGTPSFTPKSGSSDVSFTISDTDTVATIAAKINAANAGVVATPFNDGTQDRLLLRSKETGIANGFRLQVTSDTADSNNTDNNNLSRLAFDPATGAFGMADAGNTVQYGSDAKARINGLAVTSTTNTLSGNMPGVTINLLATTTSNYGSTTLAEVKNPITMSIGDDVTPAVKNVQAFVTAYNTLNQTLVDMTKFDQSAKQSSLFQGDGTILGIQSILRNMLGSVSSGSASYSRLSDVGIERQVDGSLTINTAKLSTAANNGTELQKLFITDNKTAATNGFALKFRNFAQGAVKSGGVTYTKAAALQKALDTNATEQTKVTDRAARVEASLRKKYSALDGQMASLNALSTYVTQQVTTWNKSTA
jgi:flagellar hook-associated protein 2